MGRKRDSRNSRSYKQAVDCMEAGKAKGKPYPVEVMLNNMWDAYDKAMDHKAKGEKSTNKKIKDQHLAEEITNRQRAQECAKDVAPFCHSKLGTLEVSGVDGGSIENKIVVEFVKSPNSAK